LSAVRDCLFNIFAAILRIWTLSLHPQPEDALAVVTRDPPNMGTFYLRINITFKRLMIIYMHC